MPFDGFTQQAYAQKMIDEYKAGGVPPRNVFPQSFDKNDVLYWIRREAGIRPPGRLPGRRRTVADLPSYADLRLRAQGIRIWAPPTFALLDVDAQTASSPHSGAQRQGGRSRHHHLDAGALGYSRRRQPTASTTRRSTGHQARGRHDRVLDVLAQDVGVLGIFSDWAAPGDVYANCMGLK